MAGANDAALQAALEEMLAGLAAMWAEQGEESVGRIVHELEKSGRTEVERCRSMVHSIDEWLVKMEPLAEKLERTFDLVDALEAVVCQVETQVRVHQATVDQARKQLEPKLLKTKPPQNWIASLLRPSVANSSGDVETTGTKGEEPLPNLVHVKPTELVQSTLSQYREELTSEPTGTGTGEQGEREEEQMLRR